MKRLLAVLLLLLCVAGATITAGQPCAHAQDELYHTYLYGDTGADIGGFDTTSPPNADEVMGQYRGQYNPADPYSPAGAAAVKINLDENGQVSSTEFMWSISWY